jgi:hypothetical protein
MNKIIRNLNKRIPKLDLSVTVELDNQIRDVINNKLNPSAIAFYWDCFKSDEWSIDNLNLFISMLPDPIELTFGDVLLLDIVIANLYKQINEK